MNEYFYWLNNCQDDLEKKYCETFVSLDSETVLTQEILRSKNWYENLVVYEVGIWFTKNPSVRISCIDGIYTDKGLWIVIENKTIKTFKLLRDIKDEDNYAIKTKNQKAPICKVHQCEMKKDNIPLFYGLYRGEGIAGLWEAKLKSFPNWRGFYLGGCVIKDKKYEKEFTCDLCKEAYIEWINHYSSELEFYLSEKIKNPIAITINNDKKMTLKRDNYAGEMYSKEPDSLKKYWKNSISVTNGEIELQAVDIRTKEILATTSFNLTDQQAKICIEKDKDKKSIYFKIYRVNNMGAVKLFYKFVR